ILLKTIQKVDITINIDDNSKWTDLVKKVEELKNWKNVKLIWKGTQKQTCETLISSDYYYYNETSFIVICGTPKDKEHLNQVEQVKSEQVKSEQVKSEQVKSELNNIVHEPFNMFDPQNIKTPIPGEIL